ncbi:MAG: glutamate-5-semialdehyde dehydrogenase [Proteobacteria bacterium]|nr:glutamate-5-semialdehyde dehydrogenase [Pseudomonadota bacterium]
MELTLNDVKNASYELPWISHELKHNLMMMLAKMLIENIEQIIQENKKDLSQLHQDDPKYDRLFLNRERIEGIADGLKNIAKLDSPIWKTQESYTLPNGLKLQKKTVPLGVIGIIYESRPNVTLEAFALCFMSSNACILKGGKEAAKTNAFFAQIIHDALKTSALPIAAMFMLPPTRQAVKTLLEAKGVVDVIIPRGSQALIDYVKQHATIPIIETGAGVVHTYIDESANIIMARKIITNAKMRRLSVCNALDCLIIHQAKLRDLPFLVSDLIDKEVMLYADEPAFSALKENYPEKWLAKVTPLEYGTEFLSAKLAIKTVDSLTQALLHIRQYSSGHSEAIIADNQEIVSQFFQQVDAAVVYANTSTAFTDGGEFGMGGEIGISTQKLHVRGPFSLQHLVSTKWLVEGQGQIRP